MTSLILMTLTVALMAGSAMGAPTSSTSMPIVNMTGTTGATIPLDTKANRERVTGSAVVQAVADLIAASCVFPQDNLFLRRVANSETRDGLDPRTFTDPNYHGGIWRVDQSMFQATKANTPQLHTLYEGILQRFGIDWLQVQWRDLEKPLYSGLAAAIYTAIQGQVPLPTEEQGTFLQTHYRTSTTANNFTRTVDRIRSGCDGGEHADVAFLLDVTTNDENFLRMRQYVRSVVGGFVLGPDHVQLAMYETGGGSVANIFHYNTYSNNRDQILSAISTLSKLHLPSTNPTLGGAVSRVLDDMTASRPNAAKILVLLTDSQSADNAAAIEAARAKAMREGVSIITISIGHAVDPNELDELSTNPDCTHHLSVPDYRNLKDIVQLMQHTICNEPMIAKGMVRCRFPDCRNVAFPMTSPTMTLITNVTCDDGNVFVTTRMPKPGADFADFRGYVTADGEPAYVGISDVHAGEFIYAEFFGSNPINPNCEAIISTVNGLIDLPHECRNEWEYPAYNPCLADGRGDDEDKFVYAANDGMFIQCDLRNRMYLTKCPPNEPYFHPTCKYCVGRDSPSLGDCDNAVPAASSGHCGLAGNPCTRDNIEQGNFYFACPGDETKYLQCNTWGHGFIRQCPTNFVWRQVALTCEYVAPGLVNPCQPGHQFYPYPSDPHYYIQCAFLVPYKMPCELDFVWDAADETCVAPTYSTVAVTHPTTYLVTNAPVYTTPASGHYVTQNGYGLVSRNWVAPCTRDAVSANDLYHEVSYNPHYYIQCDLWGDAYLRECQPSFYFNPRSDTCVDGTVTHGSGDAVGRRK